MGPGDAVRSVLSNLSNFSGLASRSEYWWWIGALFLAYIGAAAVMTISFEIGVILYLVIALGAIIPGLAVAVRRLHDTGRSGWWLLLAFVLGSQPGPNQWGPPPNTVSEVRR
jgi:uncharacterized membrane protein YhaH (DUF805 family)